MKTLTYIAGGAAAVFIGIVMVILVGLGLVVAGAHGSSLRTTTTTVQVEDRSSFSDGFRSGFDEEMSR